jgi:hypothetical protein
MLFSLGQETITIDQAASEAQKKESLAPLVEFLSTLPAGFAPQDGSAPALEPSSVAASSPVTGSSIQEKRRQMDRRQDGLQPEAGQSADQHKVIKVDQQRIDALMD